VLYAVIALRLFDDGDEVSGRRVVIAGDYDRA